MNARWLFITLGLCLSPWAASLAQTKQDLDYQAGFAAWQQEAYPLASDHLSKYRSTVPYGRSYDIDYLLGTSWCRMPGLANQGASMLDWALQQDMPESAARQFQGELTWCRARAAAASAPAAPRPELLVRTSVGAGASVRASGKMYYAVNGDKGAFAAYPLALVKPLPESDYERRLFPLNAGPAAAEAARQRLIDALGTPVTVLPVGRFLMASPAHSEADLRRIAERLEDFARFLEKDYDIRFAPKFITVNLAPTPTQLSKLAMGVHGLRISDMTLGYTFQNDLSVNAVMQTTAAGTLLHELFHLGVRASFGDIPSWLDESIASLYETSTESGGVYRGGPNWRGQLLRMMGGGQQFKLADLVGYLSSDRVGGPSSEATVQMRPDEAAREAALGRYFAFYLQDKGKLKAVYGAFKDRPAWARTVPAREASIRLIESATGQPVAMLETDFQGWLKEALKPPPNAQPVNVGNGTPIEKEIPNMIRQGPASPVQGPASPVQGPPGS